MDSPMRRCGRCGSPALCMRAWQHTYSGTELGEATEEYGCTSCGATFKIRPGSTVLAMWFTGGVLLALFLGIGAWVGGAALVGLGAASVALGAPFMLTGYLYGSLARKNPIDDRPFTGPLPARPIPVDERPRVCAKCGAAARCTNVTKAGWLRTLRWTFVCGGCSREFEVDSVARTIVDASFGLVMLVFGLLLVVGAPAAISKGEWSTAAIEIAVPLCGLFFLGAAGARVRHRVANKRA